MAELPIKMTLYCGSGQDGKRVRAELERIAKRAKLSISEYMIRAAFAKAQESPSAYVPIEERSPLQNKLNTEKNKIIDDKNDSVINAILKDPT